MDKTGNLIQGQMNKYCYLEGKGIRIEISNNEIGYILFGFFNSKGITPCILLRTD